MCFVPGGMTESTEEEASHGQRYKPELIATLLRQIGPESNERRSSSMTKILPIRSLQSFIARTTLNRRRWEVTAILAFEVGKRYVQDVVRQPQFGSATMRRIVPSRPRMRSETGWRPTCAPISRYSLDLSSKGDHRGPPPKLGSPPLANSAQ